MPFSLSASLEEKTTLPLTAPGEAGRPFAITLMLLFYVTKDEALTYAIVSHASNYFPFIIVGSIYFIISGLKISDIKNKANS